jgi:hypothetical protein
MTVAELIVELQKMDQYRLVILQKDSGGNGYSPLYGLTQNAAYVSESSWSGEVKLQTLPQEKDSPYTEEDLAPTNALPCVVLYPSG